MIYFREKEKGKENAFNLKSKLSLIKKIYLCRLKLEKKRHKNPFPYFKDIYKEMISSEFFSFQEIKKEWLNLLRQNNPLCVGLYIHIPFCKSKCNYCQYFSYPLHDYTERKKYLDYLRENFLFFNEVLKNIRFECLYVGGGSPNIFSEEEFSNFMKLLNENINLKEGDFERTFECSFEDISQKKLKEIDKSGFNRISFGIQSFNRKTLKKENRKYISSKKIIDFSNYCNSNYNFMINADLIMGLGFDTEADILNNVEEIVKTGVDTVTLYTIQDKLYTSQMYKDSGSIDAFYERISKLYDKINNVSKNFDFLIRPIGEGKPEVGFFLVNKKSNKKLLKEYSNNPTKKSSSIFSMGWGSKGRIKDRLEYKISSSKNFCLNTTSIECSYVSPKIEKTRFLGSSLKKGYIDLDVYFNIFNSKIIDDFEKEIIFLLRKGILKKSNEKYYWNTNNTYKKIFYFGIFYSEDDLKRIKIFN